MRKAQRERMNAGQRECDHTRSYLARVNSRLAALAARVAKADKAEGKRYRKIKLTAVLELSREISQVPAQRKITAGQARIYLRLLRQLIGRQARIEELLARVLRSERRQREHMREQILWNLILTERQDPDAFARMSKSKNAHAVALGRRFYPPAGFGGRCGAFADGLQRRLSSGLSSQLGWSTDRFRP